MPYFCSNTSSTQEYASRSEYRYYTAVPTPQAHKSMRARDERWQSFSQLSDRILLAVTTTNTTSAKEHAFRATEQEGQARDERWQSAVSSLTPESYEDTRRARPAQSTRNRTSIDIIHSSCTSTTRTSVDTILLLY